MITGKSGSDSTRFIFMVIALLLFAYTVSRAWILSFTFDESYSYTSYIKDTYFNIFTCHFLTSNNHVLNSLLMKLSTEFFAPSDFTLRWHSLVGHVFFLVFSWAVLKDIQNHWYRLGAFLLMNLNPFVLDFFSLARGYGIAMGLMMMSLYFLYRYLQGEVKNLLWLCLSIIVAGFSAIANFTMLNFMLALLATETLWMSYIHLKSRQWKKTWTELSALLISSLPFFIYIVWIAVRLNRAKEFYYGGKKGLWADTVGTLIDSTLYHAHYLLNARMLLQSLIVILSASGLFFLVFTFLIKKAKPESYRFFLAVTSIFLVMITGIQLQHILLNTYYLVDRTAMLLIPVFVLAACYLMYYLNIIWKGTSFVFVILLIASLYHFSNVMNFSKTETWPEQADVKNMMKDLNKIRLDKYPSKMDFFLCPFWTCGPAADFYRDVYHYTWLKRVEVRQPTFKENYFFFPDSEMHTFANIPVKILNKYPVTHAVLLENMAPSRREIIASGKLMMEPGEKECEGATFAAQPVKNGSHSVYLKPKNFSPALKFPLNPLIGDSFYRVEASAWVYFDNFDKRKGELVIAVGDSTKIYKWTSLQFERCFEHDGNWMHVSFGDWMPRVQSRDDIVTVSVYNNSDNVFFYVDGLEAKVIK
jgi:hypothetical protein